MTSDEVDFEHANAFFVATSNHQAMENYMYYELKLRTVINNVQLETISVKVNPREPSLLRMFVVKALECAGKSVFIPQTAFSTELDDIVEHLIKARWAHEITVDLGLEAATPIIRVTVHDAELRRLLQVVATILRTPPSERNLTAQSWECDTSHEAVKTLPDHCRPQPGHSVLAHRGLQ